MTQVLHLSFRWIKFFISLLFSIQAFVSVSGWLSLLILRCFSISPHQAFSFRCWFSNNSVQPFFVRMLFQFICRRSCLFFSILFFRWSICYSVIPEALWYCSLWPSSRFVKIMFFPLLVHLTGVLYSSLNFHHLSSFASLLTGVLSGIVLTPLVPFF